jgi:hypothetical protein
MTAGLRIAVAAASVIWTAAPHRSVPKADPDDSQSCLTCHRAEQVPLAKSRHGLASSPGLWGQLPSEGPHVGSGLACLLCHAPAPDQQPWRTLATLPADGGAGRSLTEARSLAVSGAAVVANPEFDPHARDLGVSCTACHVQAGQVVGTRADAKAPHRVEIDPELSRVALCARCHQFGTDAAVNGKPLENTAAELAASSWGQAGATCQGCHMPGGRHLFQGIHAPALVAASVEVHWTVRGPGKGELTLTNSAVGHDFPTYATPRVVLAVQPEDARGKPLGEAATRVLGRKVRFTGGAWREEFDTRVPSGQTATLAYDLALPPTAARLHATVRISPDESYIALYHDFLRPDSGLPAGRRKQIEEAEKSAQNAAYYIFDEIRNANGG